MSDPPLRKFTCENCYIRDGIEIDFLKTVASDSKSIFSFFSIRKEFACLISLNGYNDFFMTVRLLTKIDLNDCLSNGSC